MITEYNESDIDATLRLYRETQKMEIEAEINRIYTILDNCDDIWMREKWARKIKRLQHKLNTL